MKIRIANLGIKNLKSKIDELDDSLIAEITKDGSVKSAGFLTKEQLSLNPDIAFNGVKGKYVEYSKDNKRVVYYVENKISNVSKASSMNYLCKILKLGKNFSFKQKTIKPCFLALVGDERYRLTNFCSITGNPTTEIFENSLKKYSKVLTDSKCIPEFISLTETEVISLALDYIEEGNTIKQTSTNLTEATMDIRHPKNIFQDPKVKSIDKTINLRSKIDQGDWKNLAINVKNKYSVGLSKSSLDTVVFYPTSNNIENLVESNIDILQRIFKIIPKFKRSLSLSKLANQEKRKDN